MPDGHVVVTDGGDRAVKAFDFDGRGVLAVREGFCLPWGLDATPEGEVILTDSEAGALYRLTADFKNGKLKKCQMIRSQLTSPRGVAVSQTLGAVAVIEHLKAQGPNSSSTRVKIFSAEMDLVGQMDSFGFLHEKGDWLDKTIGETEASVQGRPSPAKIIAMEELPLLSA
nr:E3 ubiquitin-protein ligase NHLRC1 [Columba livia]